MKDKTQDISSNSYLPLLEEQLEYQISRTFTPMCTPLPPEQIPQLKDQIHLHVEKVHQALSHNEFLDVTTATTIAERLIKLLDRYEDYPEEQKALIVRAAHYFAQTEDAEPDTSSLLGFDDDVSVLNHVLDKIGLSEQKLKL